MTWLVVAWPWCWRWSHVLLAAMWALSDRQPAGPAARPLRPVLAGARRCTRPAAPWSRVRSPPTRTGRARRARGSAALADTAEQASRAGREAAENELSAALGRVDPASLPAALVAELADAEARVMLARRFHNDAVRDTLALRERRPVRWLRLGGTAALPTYFEIAERADRDLGLVNRRTSARVVLLDDEGAVLLFCGSDPAGADDWRTALVVHRRGAPSSRARRLAEAAVRELAEETGLRVGPTAMVGPVWRRDAVIDFNGSVIRSEEMFFVHRTDRFEPSASGRTALERRYIHGHRWCDCRRRSVSWSQVGKPSTRCSSVSCSRRRTRWPTGRVADRNGSCNRSAECEFNGFADPFRLVP